MPPINLPPKARLAVYIVTGIGSAVMTYLTAKGYVGDAEVALWVALSALAHGLAALNVNTETTEGA